MRRNTPIIFAVLALNVLIHGGGLNSSTIRDPSSSLEIQFLTAQDTGEPLTW